MKTQIDREVSKSSLLEQRSVRTTFKLSESGKNALDWLINSTKLKPKELFDAMLIKENRIGAAMDYAVGEAGSRPTKQIRKTLVVSKRALRLLNRYSQKQKIARDVIVENLILLFKALIESIAEKEKQQEKKALDLIYDFASSASSLEEKLKTMLDEDNPIVDGFGIVVITLDNFLHEIEDSLR